MCGLSVAFTVILLFFYYKNIIEGCRTGHKFEDEETELIDKDYGVELKDIETNENI